MNQDAETSHTDLTFPASAAEHAHSYRELAEFLPEAVYACDTAGRVTQFNRAAVRLWGRTPVAGAEYWCGSHAMFTVDGQALAHDQCPMAVALRESREVGRIEAVIERPDGERRYVLAHPQLTRSQHGAITGAINVVVDITERKLLEEQLRQSDRSKDAFFSMLAHELRNPLSPIITAAEAIQLKSPDPSVQRMAGVVTRQARVLSRLVDDLFDAARINHGGVPLRMSAVALEQVLEAALDLVRPSVAARLQVMTVTVEHGHTELVCDATRVAQLIGNVLINASKYTPAGGAIGLTAQVRDGQLGVTVTDNGIGIGADQLHAVFELYRQIDGGDLHGKGGMGVGLSLVKDLCQKHGGQVSAYSAGLGQGSRFDIVLPILAPVPTPSALQTN